MAVAFRESLKNWAGEFLDAASNMSDAEVDWRATVGGGQPFGRATLEHAYREDQARAFARDDRLLLESYYSLRGARFAGLSQIVELGVELTRGSDWLAQHTSALAITDVVVSEIQATYERLRTTQLSNTKLILSRNIRDFAALPPCDLLYSALSTRKTPASGVIQILGVLFDKVVAGGATLLRVPTQNRNYRLLLNDASDLDHFNVLPQWQIFDLLASSGFSLVLVQEEPLLVASDTVYHTILAQRRV
jgi:hypothetical protein